MICSTLYLCQLFTLGIVRTSCNSTDMVGISDEISARGYVITRSGVPDWSYMYALHCVLSIVKKSVPHTIVLHG